MSKAMRIRWLPALTMAIFGLLVLPGEAHADKRLDDLVFEAEDARSKMSTMLDHEQYKEAITLAEREVAAREKIVTLVKGRLPKQHTDLTPSPEELWAQALDYLARALIEAGNYTRPEALLARAYELHKKVLRAALDDLQPPRDRGSPRSRGFRPPSGHRKEVVDAEPA